MAIKFRRGSSENWEKSTEILARGQPAVEYCEDGSIKFKIGNGFDIFKDLPYVNEGDKHIIWNTFKDLPYSKGDKYVTWGTF